MRRSHGTCAGPGEQRAYLVTATVGPGMDELVDGAGRRGRAPAERRRGAGLALVGGWHRRILIAVGCCLLGFVALPAVGHRHRARPGQSDWRRSSTTSWPPPVAPATRVPRRRHGSRNDHLRDGGPPPPSRPPPRHRARGPPPLCDGDPVARLEIPRMGLDEIVVSGVGVDDSRRSGPLLADPLPGESGNAAIAGPHTYGAPFPRHRHSKARRRRRGHPYAGRSSTGHRARRS